MNQTENNPIYYGATMRALLNPYRYAARVFVDRLKWDMKPEAFRSRRILRGWKDRYPGEKAVIVCNGPSLLKTDLNLLDGIFSFGLNKINLLFDRSPFRPSVITAVNHLVIEQNQEFFNQTELPLFLDAYGVDFIRSRANVAFLNSSREPRFARDVSISLQQGFTVTFVAMQLAFHMGFRDIALIGCDHNFVQKGFTNQTVSSGEKDESHFDPRYFSGGAKWQLPDLPASEYYYSMAGQMFASFGGRIVNCTEGGNLDVFPRSPLSEWINDVSRV